MYICYKEFKIMLSILYIYTGFFQMHRFMCIVIVLAVSNCRLFPYEATPVSFGAAAEVSRQPNVPIVPTSFPFGSNHVPFRENHYRNPYYNRFNGDGSPNVPILSYSNTQDVQGSYAFRFVYLFFVLSTIK